MITRRLHEAVRDCEVRFAPLMADQLRAKRRGQVGQFWYVDETYVNIKGKWCYLYRTIDRDGNLLNSMQHREAKQGGSQTLFQVSRRCRWSCPRMGDERWP